MCYTIRRMTKCCPSFLLHKESILIVSKNIKNILRKVVLNIALAASLSSVAALLHAGGTNVPKHDSKQVECLTRAIYHESRAEGEKGMIAVAFTTLNRVKDSRFPKTICGVVYQKSQYSWTKHNPPIKEKGAYEEAKQIALEVIKGKHRDITKGSLYFNSNHSQPRGTICTIRIKNHSFYKHIK